MVCIYCGAETRVINSRLQKRSNHIWRRRQCTKCQALFTTVEKADYTKSWIVKNQTKDVGPFYQEKLLLSVWNSLKHRKTALTDAIELTNTLINSLNHKVSVDGTIQSKDIARSAQVALSRFDKAAGVSYAAYHHL